MTLSSRVTFDALRMDNTAHKFLLLSGLLLLQRVQGCVYEKISECTQVVQNDLTQERFTLATTKQDLDVYCTRMKTAHACIERETADCGEPTKKEYHKALLAEKAVMKEVCKAGQAQDEYLRYAPCFRKMFVEGGSCQKPYDKLMATTSSMSPPGPANTNQILGDMCCEYYTLHQCYMANTEKDCGAQASKVSLRSLEQIYGGMEHSCASLKSRCSSTTSAASTAATPGTQSIVSLLLASLRLI